MQYNGNLEPGDPDCFDGMQPIPRRFDDYVQCARCQGYGGWNLTLNAFKRYENGKLVGYSHFRASCDNCMGSGWVQKKYDGHVHKWEVDGYPYRCVTRYKCQGCGSINEVDSGD